MRLRFCLGIFVRYVNYYRDVEKAANEVYSFFETVQSSIINTKSLTKDCLHVYENSQPIREAFEHYNNLYTTCNTKLEREIVSNMRCI